MYIHVSNFLLKFALLAITVNKVTLVMQVLLNAKIVICRYFSEKTYESQNIALLDIM